MIILSEKETTALPKQSDLDILYERNDRLHNEIFKIDTTFSDPATSVQQNTQTRPRDLMTLHSRVYCCPKGYELTYHAAPDTRVDTNVLFMAWRQSVYNSFGFGTLFSGVSDVKSSTLKKTNTFEPLKRKDANNEVTFSLSMEIDRIETFSRSLFCSVYKQIFNAEFNVDFFVSYNNYVSSVFENTQ